MSMLTAEDWSKFEHLYCQKEGTTWYDTRELAYMVIDKVEHGLSIKLRMKHPTITQLLQIAYLSLSERKGSLKNDRY